MKPFSEVKNFTKNVKALHRQKNWRFFCTIVAVYCVCIIAVGVNYSPVSPFPEMLPNGLDIVANVFSPNLFAVIWIAAGLWGFLSAVTGLRSLNSFKYIFALCIAWALIYFLGFFIQGGTVWVNGFAYLRASIAPLLIMWVYTSKKARQHGG